MKKNNIKPLVMSALTALAMGAVGTVGTFALFTDKAETEISIGSGTVKIGTVATLVKYQSSVDGTNQDLTGETSYVNTLVGSSFGLDGNTINISKMVPGDKLTLRVVSRNESDIKTKIRYVISHAKVGTKKDLFPALKVNFEPEDNATVADLFRWTQHDAAPSGGEEIHSTLVTVEFPNHGFEITSRDKGIDNQYQDAACSISFALEAVQANAALDPIEEINAYLKAELFFEGHNDTMHDAVIDMAEIGYTSLSVLDGYVYEYAEDRFVAADSVTSDYHKYFKAVSNQTSAGNFSIYAANDWSDANVTLTGVGFDVGNSEVVESVTYNGALEARSNIIRTNSLATNVTIDAENDTVYRYGSAGVVNIIAVYNESYHEYGKVAFLQVASGRVALEKESEVAQLHFVYNGTEKKFEEIIVAYDEEVELPTFSRDAVPLTDIQDNAKLVVELQNSTIKEEAESDFVWLFQQGLKEQMRVSDSAESAGDVKATDSSVKEETSKAAEEIANNFTATAQEYTPAEIAAGNVDVADIAESGIEAAQKDGIINDKVEQVITEEALEDKTHNYVARIGTKYYESFDDAFTAVSEGKTIRIIDNCEGHGLYDTKGRNLNILVEKNKTVDFGSFINERFILSGTNASTLTFEGPGTLRFHGNANHGLVHQINSGDNIRTVVKELTVIADGAAGYIADGNVIYKSGVFENIVFTVDPVAVEGGLFNFDFSNYLPDGKMAAKIDDTHYAIADLDEAHSNFILLKATEGASYYRTLAGALKDAESGDLVEARLPNQTYSITSQQDNVSVDYNNITIDLKGGTMEVGSAHYAFYFSSIVSFTLKNATINASKFCTVSANQGCHLSPQNVLFKDGMSDVEDNIADGYNYVKDTDTNYFTYVSGAPEEYALSVERSSKVKYYSGSNAFATVFDNLADNDEIYLNAQAPSNIVVPMGLTIVLEWANNIDEPTVDKDEQADLLVVTQLGENRKSYFAKSEVVAKVVNGDETVTTFKDLAAAFQSLEKNQGATLTLLDNVDLNGTLLKIVNSTNSSSLPMKIDAIFDLNGKTITSNKTIFEFRMNTGCYIEFVDTSAAQTGRIVCTSTNANDAVANFTRANSTSGNGASVTFTSGVYENTGTGAVIRTSNNYEGSKTSYKGTNAVYIRTTMISNAPFLQYSGNNTSNLENLNKSVVLYSGSLVRYTDGVTTLTYYLQSHKFCYNNSFGYVGTATQITEGEYAGYLSVS